MNQVITVSRNIDCVADEIGQLYRAARGSVIETVRYLFEAGDKLIKQKKSLPHGKWLQWLEDNREILGFDYRVAARIIQVVLKLGVNAEYGEKEALQISRQIWGNTNHRAQGTGENEWYTPEKYIELARVVLGEIDLDPASSEIAQRVVKASSFFTQEQNGLRKNWGGRVWLNPPYTQPDIANFVSKMIEERCAERVTAAIMLTHNYTDTSWFHQATEISNAICFTRGRIKFVDAEGNDCAPTQGQAFFYFGDDIAKFAEEFLAVGFVVTPQC